jgi:uncharacterized protein with GYD domain
VWGHRLLADMRRSGGSGSSKGVGADVADVDWRPVTGGWVRAYHPNEESLLSSSPFPGRQRPPEEVCEWPPTSRSSSSPRRASPTIKDGPARLDSGKETLKAFGSELKAFYLTMGRYDVVAISEAPDDEAAAKVALAIGSAGNVTTETLRAFTEDEYRSIVAALP